VGAAAAAVRGGGGLNRLPSTFLFGLPPYMYFHFVNVAANVLAVIARRFGDCMVIALPALRFLIIVVVSGDVQLQLLPPSHVDVCKN
jgi:hypothetical protein